MAKNSGGDDRAKVKLRVIEFELEGGNSSVENSIRQLTQSLATRTNIASVKSLAARPSTALPFEDDETDVGSAEPEEVDAEELPAAPARPRTARKLTVPEPIEVDLTSGETPFKQYCDQRGINSASSDTKKYLVAAMWMKDHRQAQAIEVGQVYSIFKVMKWNLPSDIGSPLRSMKKNKWFTTPERGKFAINHLGENEVNSLGS